MTDDLEEYIEAHISAQPDYLAKIDRLTNLRHVNGRMCSGHLQGRLLKMLVAMINPSRVLEIGTFTGYSALCIAEGLEEGATLDTIEIDDELEEPILENFNASPFSAKIRLHIGDALDVCSKFNEGEFDLVFIDGDKRKYVECFRSVFPLVKKGGFIFADNTLWDGHVVENCRHSSQTAGIIAFNDYVASLPEVETVIIPLRDGLSIIRKL